MARDSFSTKHDDSQQQSQGEQGNSQEEIDFQIIKKSENPKEEIPVLRDKKYRHIYFC